MQECLVHIACILCPEFASKLVLFVVQGTEKPFWRKEMRGQQWTVELHLDSLLLTVCVMLVRLMWTSIVGASGFIQSRSSAYHGLEFVGYRHDNN